LNILFVEDVDDIRNNVSLILKRYGHGVKTAKNGLEAITIFEENPDEIDCIILDLVMPRLAGYETFLALRIINPNIKIILTSGFSTDKIINRFKNLKYSGYLQKPFTKETLIKIITEAENEKGTSKRVD
jgi:CheY-like chemotaxis protein